MSDQKAIWKNLSAGWRKWERPLLNSRQALHDRMVELANIGNTSKVLDLATGVGEPALTAAKRYPNAEIVGVDASPEMLAIAHERVAREKVHNFALNLINSHHLPFPDGYFDAALCCFGLEFIPEPLQVLHEVQRVIKPSAKLIVATWSSELQNPFLAISANTVNWAKGRKAAQTLPKFSKPEEMRALIESAGMGALSICHTGQFVLKDAQELWGLKCDTAVSLMQLLQDLPESERERVRKYFFEECSRYQNDKNQVVMPYEAWLTVCTKN